MKISISEKNEIKFFILKYLLNILYKKTFLLLFLYKKISIENFLSFFSCKQDSK